MNHLCLGIQVHLERRKLEIFSRVIYLFIHSVILTHSLIFVTYLVSLLTVVGSIKCFLMALKLFDTKHNFGHSVCDIYIYENEVWSLCVFM